MEKPDKSHWVPDSAAKSCRICQSEFTLLNRRHHCRSCGQVVCSQCSSSKAPLKALGFKEAVRLCDICAKDVQISQREQVKIETTSLTYQDAVKEWVFLCTVTSLTPELERRIIRGIPNTLRSVAWPALAEATVTLEKNPGVYEKFRLCSNEEAEIPILLDIPRTFPDHPRFGVNGTDANQLYNLLRAYSNFNKEIGYTQGMSFIAAVLLMHMNEETSFWVFVQMLKRYNLAPFFTDGVYPQCLKDLTHSFKQRLPELDAHMKREGCQIAIFGVQWIRTLFALDFELSIAFRLWDIFFVQGLDFVTSFIITMFHLAEEDILALHGGDMLLFIKALPSTFHKDDRWDEVIRLSIRSHSSVQNYKFSRTKT